MGSKKKKDQDAERKKQIAEGTFVPKKVDRTRRPKVEAHVPEPVGIAVEPLQPEELAITRIPIGQLHVNPDNPNVMTDRQFNLLVESVRRDGFTNPLHVAPIMDPADPRFDKHAQQYEVVAGEHRLDVLKALKWEKAPCIINRHLGDKDARDVSMIRDNILKGDLDPTKFTRMYERLMPKYGAEMVEGMMGFADRETLDMYIVEAEGNLPDDAAKAEFRKKKKDIKTMEDLSRILNSIWSKYGSTIEYNFLNFEFGGHTHCVIWMDRATKNVIEEITTFVAEHQLDINKVMHVVLTRGWDKTVPELVAEGGAEVAGEAEADEEALEDEEEGPEHEEALADQGGGEEEEEEDEDEDNG